MLPFRKEIRSTELAPAKESWQPAGQPGSEPEQRKGATFIHWEPTALRQMRKRWGHAPPDIFLSAEVVTS